MRGVDPTVLQGAFESVGIPVMLLDEQFRVAAINDAGVSFVGYDRETLLGKPVELVLAKGTAAGDIRRQLRSGADWDGDLRLRTADGRIVTGQVSVAPLESSADDGTPRNDGTVEGERVGDDGTPGESRSATDGGRSAAGEPAYVAALVDGRQKQQYEHAAEVLDRLLRHDLRNGLNLVYGYLQQARSRVDDEPARKRLADARRTLGDVLDKSDRARDLRELLDRAYERPTYPVRLDRVLTDCVSRVDDRYSDATVETGQLPSVTVAADELLGEAIEGVIENGVVHDETDPHVTVAVTRRETTAVVEITDQGPGISQPEADHVFGRGQTDALNHGDGLSLFFVDSLVRSYDGQIWFDTPDDAGTVFKIELARVDASS